MARIDTAQLIQYATDIGHFADRISQVQQDPAAQKACKQAGRDVTRAFKSVGMAVFEVRTAYRRTSPGGGAGFVPLQG